MQPPNWDTTSTCLPLCFLVPSSPLHSFSSVRSAICSDLHLLCLSSPGHYQLVTTHYIYSALIFSPCLIVTVYTSGSLYWIPLQFLSNNIPPSPSSVWFYHFTARGCSFALHAHHNEQALCTPSAASGVARTEPSLHRGCASQNCFLRKSNRRNIAYSSLK